MPLHLLQRWKPRQLLKEVKIHSFSAHDALVLHFGTEYHADFSIAFQQPSCGVCIAYGGGECGVCIAYGVVSAVCA